MKQKRKKMSYWEPGLKKQEMILWSILIVEALILAFLWIHIFVLKII